VVLEKKSFKGKVDGWTMDGRMTDGWRDGQMMVADSNSSLGAFDSGELKRTILQNR